MSRDSICAGCDASDFKQHPQEAAGGMMRCFRYDGSESEPFRRFVPYDAPGCVLYCRATKDLAERRAYVRQQKEREAAKGA